MLEEQVNEMGAVQGHGCHQRAVAIASFSRRVEVDVSVSQETFEDWQIGLLGAQLDSGQTFVAYGVRVDPQVD